MGQWDKDQDLPIEKIKTLGNEVPRKIFSCGLESDEFLPNLVGYEIARGTGWLGVTNHAN